MSMNYFTACSNSCFSIIAYLVGVIVRKRNDSLIASLKKESNHF